MSNPRNLTTSNMTIHLKYHIKGSVNDVWQALVNPNAIKAWSGSTAEMEPYAGSEFNLWKGDVFGRNIEIIPKQRIVQEWYEKSWSEPSIVTFLLTPENSATNVELIQQNIPELSYEAIEFEWQDSYLGAVKDYVERTA